MSDATAKEAAVAFQKAVALHQQGRLSEAQTAYRRVLRLKPEHPGALNLLGAIALVSKEPTTALDLFTRAIRIDPHSASAAYYGRGIAFTELKQWELALASYERAIALKPDFAEAFSNRGNVLVELKRWEDALASYERAIALNPDYAEALSNRGNVLTVLKQWEPALASYERAIALKPEFAEAFSNRGMVLAELKQWDAALASCERAIALKPDYAEAFSNRGRVLTELKRWETALASCERAIALKPDYAEAFSNRGNALAALKQWEEALASYDRAIALKPAYAEAFSNRGIALAELKQWEAALVSFERAIALRPNFAEAFLNRGAALAGLRQREAALASCERAIALMPDYAEAYVSRGNLLGGFKQWDAALASYERAIALKPDYAEAHFSRSMLWLLLGEFSKGWVEHEWRWNEATRTTFKDERHFSQPRWIGAESIVGRTILLYDEQGLGDTLQFCRYSNLVANLGAKVILEVHAPLLRVLSSLDGVSQLLPRGGPLPSFDYHSPLMSLPLAFKTDIQSIPRAHRYLASEASKIAQWKSRLGQSNEARIGLTWSGNPNYRGDHNRSIALEDLVRYLPEGFQYVSLQKDIREADRTTLQSRPAILNFADEIVDFADTAALCECVDLVITVDTSVAHLSAALGQRTWILLPFVPDWRWLLDRDDSPWYPSVTLYRQDAVADWNGVLERVGRELCTEHWTHRRN